jgi:hypothetical protein
VWCSCLGAQNLERFKASSEQTVIFVSTGFILFIWECSLELFCQDKNAGVDAADFPVSSVITLSFPPHFLLFLRCLKLKVVNLAFLLRQLSYQMVQAHISGLLGNLHMWNRFFFSCDSTAQFWALAASMKLYVLFQFLDLGQSAGLLGRVISSSQGLC